ncbi:hypothetical protein M8494_04735 [Serratia ureilytica]
MRCCGIAPACALVAIGLLLHTGREVSVVRAPNLVQLRISIVMFSRAAGAWLCCCWRCATARPAWRRWRGMLPTLR